MRRPSKAGGPTYYMQIDGNGRLLFGAGEYMPPPHRLKRCASTWSTTRPVSAR
jgi:hypothetical protein